MSYISIIEATRDLKMPEGVVDFKNLNTGGWSCCGGEFDQEVLDGVRNIIKIS